MEFFFFLKVLFWACNFFYILPHVPVDIIRVCFWFQVFYQKILKCTKTSEKDHSFYDTSLILWTSTHLIFKMICSTAKNLCNFTNFLAIMLKFGVRKNIYTAPFLDVQELHSWSTSKANVCIFLYISVRKFLFQRRSKFLSDRMWVGSSLNNFLQVACCLGFVKCFTVFHFNWNFWKFDYFSAFRYFHL